MNYTSGKLIREFRLEKKISQVKIAKALGVSSQYIANVERGVCNLAPIYIKKTCKMIGLDTELLIDVMVDDCRSSLKKIIKG